jgi:4-hydroxy-3-methylbut-2-enyl diphosphate reductase
LIGHRGHEEVEGTAGEAPSHIQLVDGAEDVATECDLVLVVGSTNSSNSVRLVEVALEAGARDSHLVDFASEIDPAWLAGVGTVGVTSGASVPEILVSEVLDWLAERGYADVETVKAAEERLVFALPHELRRAEKAAQAD